MTDFLNELDMAITVCTTDGTIIYMNNKSIKTFEENGGDNLIGTNLLECHPEPARAKLAEMLKLQQPNTYTIEKKGIKKIIIQKPWYSNGKYSGFVELSIEIPTEMPHLKRF